MPFPLLARLKPRLGYEAAWLLEKLQGCVACVPSAGIDVLSPGSAASTRDAQIQF